jgi:hypothetical protein
MKLLFVSAKSSQKRQRYGRLSQLYLHAVALYDTSRGTAYKYDKPEDSVTGSDQEHVTMAINDTTNQGKYDTSNASTTASQAYLSTECVGTASETTEW